MNHYKNISLIDIDGEVWKEIQNYEKEYAISNYGRVKSLKRIVARITTNTPIKERILKIKITRAGYGMVHLKRNGKCLFTHRLVAKAFIPNPENKKEVNHINGNSLNNDVSNLEWCTAKENSVHAAQILRRKIKIILQYDNNGGLIKEWDSAKSVISETKFCIRRLRGACASKIGQHGYKGYVWKYKINAQKLK
jgi:hypothetical protein